jgi:outer membrane protein W
MKKNFVFAMLLAGLATTISAQESKTRWIGGTLILQSQENGQKTSSTTFMPEVGFHLNENWSVGGRVGFSSYKQENVIGETQKTNTVSLVPFARYTFGAQSGLNFFGQGELPLHFYGGEYYNGSSMESSNSVGFIIRPGLSYSFSPKWGLNMLMPPILQFRDGPDSSSYFRFGINDGYSIQDYFLETSIGFVYRF